jgi:hypothetical protein
VSLFGSGIRSEAHHEFKAALKDNGERLSVTFVPTGVVVEGKPTRPRALSPVRIGKASLVVERQKEQKEQEEK